MDNSCHQICQWGNPCTAANKAKQEWKCATGRAPWQCCRAWAAHTHQETSNTPGRLQGLVKFFNIPLTARATQDGKHVKHVACWLVKLDLQPLWTAKTVLRKWRVTLLLTPPSAPFSSSTRDLTLHVTSSPYTPHGSMIAHALICHCFPPSTYLFHRERYSLQLIFYMKKYLAVFRVQEHAKADFLSLEK